MITDRLRELWRQVTGKRKPMTMIVIDTDWLDLPDEEIERLVRLHKRRITL